MDSEDYDMQDANDDDYLDYDGDSKFIDDDTEDDDDDDSDDDDTTSNQEKNYTILNEEDICQRLEEVITRICNFLTVSKASASILLRHYDWSASKLHDAWFADEEKVRSEVGLLDRPVLEIPNTVKEMDCGICFESFPIDKMNAAACGHPFCSECWTAYISTSVTDGPGCLTLRCPQPSCGAAVGQDMINLLSSDENKQKYFSYLLRSYIENNRKTKWCPAPGCNYAVDFVVGSGSYDVSCKCSHGFCWNCTQEVHRPVDCSTVANWILKNSAESENTNWILANSKPCPKCKRPIEKISGCMHMVCTPPCKFHFCWLCLGDWSDHGEKTGGYYACNKYQKAKEDGVFDEAERRREMAKTSIQRYTHYYERWTANHSSRKKAVADLNKMNSVHIDKLREKQCQSELEVTFVTEAWLQIIECRRVLKWTYAYGFYIPEQEHTRRKLFEYLQGEAESGLERLHHCAEKELQGYLNSDGASEDFNEFRNKLVGLTKTTRNYFENLVRALENGLSDVKSQQGACSKPGSSNNLEGTKARDERGNRSMSRSSEPNRVEEDSYWLCEHCTFANEDTTTTDCRMCNLPRYEKAKEDGEFDEAQRRREMAKTSLQRYTHYYERWATNHSSWKKAVAYLEQINSVHIKKLSDKQCQIMFQLNFITDAWVQIIECRRVLKWTYAYGYYLPEHEHTKKQLFEYLQGEAESVLEKLHHCAKEELQVYLNLDGPSENFNEFRKKLAGLTSITRKYFENLVRALENGLSDVKSQQGACSKSGTGSSKNSGGTTGRDGRGKGTMSRSSSPNRVEEDYHWFCEHCTFPNEDITTTDCQMCSLPRYFLEM